MLHSIFRFEDYKTYLHERMQDPVTGGGRGAKTRLSQAIGCQTAYTAQIFRGSAHLSLEQAEAANEFLGHTEEEGAFFLLLVQLARAGTAKLRERFQRELKKKQVENQNLKGRFGSQPTLTLTHQTTYYSTWYFAAIHILVTIPRYRTPPAIAKYLGLEVPRVQEALNFLRDVNLVQPKKDGYHPTEQRLYLGADSPLISKHHLNWRLQATRSLERREERDLHYSSVVSVSEGDSVVIREILTQTLQEIKKLVRASPEESLQCLSLDFFRV